MRRTCLNNSSICVSPPLNTLKYKKGGILQGLAGILQGLETIKILLYFYYLHKQKAKEMEMISFKDVPQNQRRNLSGQP